MAWLRFVGVQEINSTASIDYKLILGDSTKKSTLKKGTVDLTITSPPYNVGLNYEGECNDSMTYEKYLKFSRKWLANVYHWTRPTGRLCLNVGLDKNKHGKKPVCADLTQIAMDEGWKYHATIIWNEGTVSRRTAWGSWMSASAPHVIAPVEVIIVLYKDEWKRDHRGTSTITKEEFMAWTNGVWVFNGARKNGHPAPFPQKLPDRCIKLFSYLDDVILDPFVGSGTTTIAAIKNKRRSVGIEMSAEYHDLATKLVREACQPKLLNVG